MAGNPSQEFFDSIKISNSKDLSKKKNKTSKRPTPPVRSLDTKGVNVRKKNKTEFTVKPDQKCSPCSSKNKINNNKRNVSSISVEDKNKKRDEFLEALRARNKFSNRAAIKVADIKSVLRQNKCPELCMRERILYKYFGKGKLRPVTDTIYNSMEEALKSDNLQTTKFKIATAEAEAEKVEQREALNALLEKKVMTTSHKSTEVSRLSSTAASVAPTGSIKGFLSTAKQKPVNKYSHAVKCHMLCMYSDQIIEYGSSLDDEGHEKDTFIERNIEEQFYSILQDNVVSRMMGLKVEDFNAQKLIIECKRMYEIWNT